MKYAMVSRVARLLKRCDDFVEVRWQRTRPQRDSPSAALVVLPNERLSWPQTVGMGAQHCLAMFGGTVLVPLLTGFAPSTALFFSGIGTLLFLTVTKHQVPSYLGSSFAFIAPAKAAASRSQAQCGFVATGALLALVGVVVHFVGRSWIEVVLPPVVTGTVVVIIGVNLAPAAKAEFFEDPLVGCITAATIILLLLMDRGVASRLSIVIGVVVGTAVSLLLGHATLSPAFYESGWIGLPEFALPQWSLRAVTLCAPTVVVLVAENAGHLKAVSTLTGSDLNSVVGRAFVGDGVGTVLAGMFGGIGTTTYAENIGVMASTRAYSTLVYVIAALTAVVLSLCPKFGALLSSLPKSVMGGTAVVLYGMIAVLGVRLWVEHEVDFRHPANLVCAGVCIVVGAADFGIDAGGVQMGGIGLGCLLAVCLFPLGHWLHAQLHRRLLPSAGSEFPALPEPSPFSLQMHYESPRHYDTDW